MVHCDAGFGNRPELAGAEEIGSAGQGVQSERDLSIAGMYIRSREHLTRTLSVWFIDCLSSGGLETDRSREETGEYGRMTEATAARYKRSKQQAARSQQQVARTQKASSQEPGASSKEQEVSSQQPAARSKEQGATS